jgi:hypothetical protein
MEKSAMSFRGLACGAALVLGMTGIRAEAAWDNAFQVTCFGCRNNASYYTPAPAASYYYPAGPVVAAAPPCGCPCQPQYVQRSYYVPVTTYKTVLDPVTTYRTSYYYEPVCSYRTSCYRDACSGASIQVTQPVTSFRVRSKCDPVTSYVQRCVPVTSYRIGYRLEPVSDCAPPACPSSDAAAAVQGTIDNPAATNPNYIPRPGVQESPAAPAQPNSLPLPAVPSYKPATNAPALDRITSNPNGASIRGQVVANNFVTPLRGAKVLFVSNKSDEVKQTTIADTTGRFALSLPAGEWKIFVSSANGNLEYHSSINVQDNQNRQFMVVSR